jgi:hypothetical protein
VFSHDGERVIATDWTGKVTVWLTKTGKPIAELAANPPMLAEQMAAAQQRLTELQSGNAKPSPTKAAADNALTDALKDLAKANDAVEKARAALAPKEAEDARLKAEVLKNRTPELEAKRLASRAAREQARVMLTNALTAFEAKTAQVAKLKEKGGEVKTVDPAEEIAALKARLSQLKAAQVYATVYNAKESIAAKKRDQEKLLASGSKADKSAAEKLGKQIAKEEKDLQKLASDYEKGKSAAIAIRPVQQTKL